MRVRSACNRRYRLGPLSIRGSRFPPRADVFHYTQVCPSLSGIWLKWPCAIEDVEIILESVVSRSRMLTSMPVAWGRGRPATRTRNRVATSIMRVVGGAARIGNTGVDDNVVTSLPEKCASF